MQRLHTEVQTWPKTLRKHIRELVGAHGVAEADLYRVLRRITSACESRCQLWQNR